VRNSYREDGERDAIGRVLDAAPDGWGPLEIIGPIDRDGESWWNVSISPPDTRRRRRLKATNVTMAAALRDLRVKLEWEELRRTSV